MGLLHSVYYFLLLVFFSLVVFTNGVRTFLHEINYARKTFFFFPFLELIEHVNA